MWSRAVGQTFLEPYGLYDAADPVGFGPAAGSVASGDWEGPASAARCHRPRAARPFPVVHATLSWPEARSDSRQRLPFEYTPLYVGSPQRRVLRDARAGARTVGGTYVEPLGFGCAAPQAKVDAGGLLALAPPARPFTLGDMVGASSALDTPDWDVRAYPHAPYWTLPGADGGPCAVNDLFTDGGEVDPLALLGMLRRRIPAVVVFINSVWPLSLDHDARHWPHRGQIDPAVPPLFGQPSPRWPHNRIFSPPGYREVVSAWQAAKHAGCPLVVSTRLRVEPNAWWGIEGGWEVSVCWVYNDRVPSWEARLGDNVRGVLPSGDGDAPDGPLARFPQFRTVGENIGALTRLTPTQANMLAELTGLGRARVRGHARGPAGVAWVGAGGRPCRASLPEGPRAGGGAGLRRKHHGRECHGCVGWCRRRPDDEELFAGANHAELAARQIFNESRLIGQGLDVTMQPAVLGVQHVDEMLQLGVLLVRPEQRDEPNARRRRRCRPTGW